jgi:pimeloyl-ACP methyl ester carboxylesterase
VVLWCHGTPGARRQFPLLGRRAAEKLGMHVVVVERPGSGLSDPHAYAAVADWATDIAQVADTLGAQRLGVVGLSGGGPYALGFTSSPCAIHRPATPAAWLVELDTAEALIVRRCDTV